MTWGRMALAKDVGASDTTIEVTPEPGVTIPAQNVSSEFQALPRDVKRAGLGSWGVGSCSIGDEWVTCQRVRALPGGNWEIQVKRKAGGAAHPAGALVRGFLKGNVYYLPDPFSELYEEVDLTMLQFTYSCVAINLQFYVAARSPLDTRTFRTPWRTFRTAALTAVSAARQSILGPGCGVNASGRV